MKKSFYKNIIVYISIFFIAFILSSCGHAHNYVFDSFVWSEDGKSAQAKYVCSNDETHIEMHEAEVTSSIKSPATCTTKGVTLYTATYDGHTDSKEVEDVEALNHNYVFDSFVWSEDGKSAQAKYVCSNDETHIEMHEAEVTSSIKSPATCTTKGATLYTATYDGHTDTKEAEDIEALNHNYVFDSFVWSEDGKSAEAKYVCSNDETHIEMHEAEVTSTIKSPSTCTTKGVTLYTATYDGHTDSKEVEDVEALNHNYVFDSFVWSEDGKSAQAKYVCSNDETHIEMHEAEVTSSIKSPATCTTKGVTLYTATYDGHTDTKEVEDIDMIEHSYSIINTVDATFDEDGHIDYKCDYCGDTKTEVIPKKEVAYVITINSDSLDDVRVDSTGEYVLPVASKTGYKFIKWVDENNEDFASTGTVSSNKTVTPIWELEETTTIEQLELYLASGVDYINITSDIIIDRTLYVTGNSIIYSTKPVILSRSADFGGDLFVLGETKDGENCLINSGNCSLDIGVIGNSNEITIDGNKENMNCEVYGSVFFIANSSYLNIYEGVTIKDNHKVGNEKALESKYYLSSPEKAGGSVAILSNGVMNIYGGLFTNNSVNNEDSNTANSYYGGVIYNNANVNIYGGTFTNNTAGRGGVICNYKICRVYEALFENNTATKYGGVAYLVDSQYSELIIGDDDLEDNGTVVFRNNTSEASGGAIFAQTLSAIIIYNNAVFDSNSSTTGNGGAINCSGVLLDFNSKYINNSAFSKGGAVYLYYGDNTLTRRQSRLENVIFENNSANRGGALGVSTSDDTYEKGCIASLKKCIFKENSAIDKDGTSLDMHGGAIYISRKSEVTIFDSDFISNSALNEGGAIYETGESYLTINGSNFEKNTATMTSSNGGAISLHSSRLNVTDSNFNENTIAKNGGAIYISYTSSSTLESLVTLKNVTFTKNNATNYGGAVYITGRSTDNQNVKMFDCIFTSNTSEGNGGALYLTNDSIYLKNVDFIENCSNSTNYGGGAIYSTGGLIEFDTGNITSNTSSYNGAGLALYSSSQVVLNEVKFEKNNSSNYGGALYVNKSEVSVYSSNFKENEAKNGGAIGLYTSAKMNIYQSSFDGNVASNNGAAIYAYSGSTEKSYICDSTFSNNVSSNYGGAIYISQASLLSLETNAFDKNSAVQGGVIYITTTGTTVDIIGITLNDNTATSGPIIYGNTTKAIVNYDSSLWVDEQVSNLNDSYWSNAFVNKITKNDVNTSKTNNNSYVSKQESVVLPTIYDDGISFEDIYAISQSSSEELIDPAWENYPKLNNPLNFQGRQLNVFENINGKDVSVESFVYEQDIPQNNPNVGEALLIWQAILYKNKYPDKDVYIDFTTFHLSIYAAICINRNSRYFGYMYPLHDKEYNEYGFVRVSYLLVLAAKMGIHTTVIGQIDAAKNLVRDNNLNIVEIPDESFVNYFNMHLKSNAFDGESISKYLLFKECKWTSYGDKGATDMMHVKICSVSNYLDSDNVERENAVFFSSINLDSLSYTGINYGNNGMQTGCIVSNHEMIYNTTHNYVRLMYNYCAQEDVYLFRELIHKLNKKQIQAALANNFSYNFENQIVYIGTETDSTFRLYFTPMGSESNVWDEIYNPFCNFYRQLSKSLEYAIITMASPKFNRYTLSDFYLYMIEKGMNSANDGIGKLEIWIPNPSDFNIKNTQLWLEKYKHNKDVLISLINNGVFQNISILNSLNTHTGSSAYQCNHILIIIEKYTNESIFKLISYFTSDGYVDL